MLTIQIKNWDNEVIATVNNIFSLQVDDEVNKWWKLKLRFPVEKWLQKQPIQKADRISVTYWLKIWKVVRIFEGYITDVTLKSTECVIEAENWLSYLQNRIIKTAKSYTAKPINEVVSEIFTELNTTQALPLSLWYNNCTTQITKDFDVWESFFDILKYCWEAEPKLVVRVINVNEFNFLEVSTNWGNVLEGVWEFDVNYTRWTNITDWSWKDSMDEFYSSMQTAQGTTINEEFLQRTKLLFEKYEEEGALSLPSGIALPSISVSRDTDWWNFNIWDRKNIRLVTGYDWLPLEYLWLIQSRKITVSPTNDIKAEIKISEDYKADTNILDLIIENLRGKKTTSWKAPDMTNYYTKEATNQAINAAIATKANISHTHLVQDITDFAQAVANFVTSTELTNILSWYSQVWHSHVIANVDWLQTALDNKAAASHTHSTSDVTWLDDALEDIDTALAWKASSVHTHQISDVTNLQDELDAKADADDVYIKDEVDDLLEWKADTVHDHEISDVNWLQTALDNKAASSHSHSISDVTNLQTALNNKADSTHNHTISDVTWLQTALDNKAASTHTHQISDTTGLQTALDNKADASSVYTKTEIDNMNLIDNTVSNLVNYYTKSETYTKTEIDNKLSQFWSFKRVSTLPTTDIKTTVIYLLWPIGTGSDQYEEYIYDTTDGWVKIWETSVDLTNYFNKDNDTADDITEGTTHLFLTAAERLKLTNTSGTNTGDETTNTIKTKLGSASSSSDWYLTKEDRSTFNNKQDAIDDADDIDEWTSHKFMTASERSKLAWIEAWAEVNTITGVKWDAENSYRTWDVNITKANIWLGNVNNTSDMDKPISTAVQQALDTKASSVHTHTISDITNLETTLNQKALKTQIKYFVITEDMVTVTKEAWPWVSPYNTSYWYTNITINSWIDSWIEWAVYSFVVDSTMVVTSAYRNVRVRIWDTWTYIPLMSTTSVIEWNSYLVKTQMRQFQYSTKYQSTWALHMFSDSNTTYSAMSVAEWTTGTATSSRVMRADYLKQIIQYYLQNIATPTGDDYAANKKYVDDINDAIQISLDTKASATHTHSQYQLTSNMVTSLANADNDHYPTAKAVYDAITQAWGWDMMKSTYDPDNKNADAFDYRNFTHVPTIWNAELTIEDSEWNEVWTFTANATQDVTITLPESWTDTATVSAIIDMKLWDYDSLFSVTNWLYQILNSIDTEDEIWLSSWDTRAEIVADDTSMSLISHCYAVMCYIANSTVAMSTILADASATDEISECWNSISIISESELASDLYLASVNGITSLFTYQTAQDAFFTSTARKTQIVSDNLMVIVNDDTLLAQLNTDSVVQACIVGSTTALSTIAWDNDKLEIVKENTAIMNAIAVNSTALAAMSDSDFFEYILEDSTYLTTCAWSTNWKAKINSYAADDLLDPIYFWTGDLWYNTFAALAADDTSMEIVQANVNASTIVRNNDECIGYIQPIPATYRIVSYIASSWTQYINTGYTCNANTQIEAKISWWTQTTKRWVFFWVTWNDRSSDWVLWRIYGDISTTFNGWFCNTTHWECQITTTLDTFHEIILKKNSCSIDWTSYTITTNSTPYGSPMDIFAWNNGWTHWWRWSIMKLKEFIISENWVEKRHFYPCYRVSDNVIWLYDLVNNQFYTNSWTWTFTKW